VDRPNEEHLSIDAGSLLISCSGRRSMCANTNVFIWHDSVFVVTWIHLTRTICYRLLGNTVGFVAFWWWVLLCNYFAAMLEWCLLLSGWVYGYFVFMFARSWCWWFGCWVSWVCDAFLWGFVYLVGRWVTFVGYLLLWGRVWWCVFKLVGLFLAVDVVVVGCVVGSDVWYIFSCG